MIKLFINRKSPYAPIKTNTTFLEIGDAWVEYYDNEHKREQHINKDTIANLFSEDGEWTKEELDEFKQRFQKHVR